MKHLTTLALSAYLAAASFAAGHAATPVESAFPGRPHFERRILNHWDNLDGTIERGYAGRSLWQWDLLPDSVSPRYEEYARLISPLRHPGISVGQFRRSHAA